MRHWDLCKLVGTQPLKVIVNFVDAIRTMELVPVHWIPVMEAQTTVPTPAPTQPSQRAQPRAKKPVVPAPILLVPMEEDEVPDDEDFDMGEDSEDAIPVIKASHNKGKHRTDIVVALKKGGSKQGALAKQVLQDSPSRQESIMKRAKTTGQARVPKIDLGRCVLYEFDVVTEDNIPGSTTAVHDTIFLGGMRD
jgi:hypothetical protein